MELFDCLEVFYNERRGIDARTDRSRCIQATSGGRLSSNGPGNRVRGPLCRLLPIALSVHSHGSTAIYPPWSRGSDRHPPIRRGCHARRSTSCSQISARARSASDAIMRSFTLIELTALDIVDMQVRLQGETARLASALRELGQGGGAAALRARGVRRRARRARRSGAAGRGRGLPERGPGAARRQRQALGLREDSVEALHRHPDRRGAARQHHDGTAGADPGDCRRRGAGVRRGEHAAQRSGGESRRRRRRAAPRASSRRR